MVNESWNKFPGGHGASCRGCSSSWPPWSLHSIFPMMPYRSSPAPVKATCTWCCSAPPGWWAKGTSTCGHTSARTSPCSAGSLCPSAVAPLPAAGGGGKRAITPQLLTAHSNFINSPSSWPSPVLTEKNILYLDQSMGDWFLLLFSKKPSFTLYNEYFFNFFSLLKQSYEVHRLIRVITVVAGNESHLWLAYVPENA